MKFSRLKIPDPKGYVEKFGPDHIEYLFMCPGCKFDHRVITHWGSLAGRKQPTWAFNNSFEKPTFQPSLLVQWKADGKNNVCHSYITDGKISFLPDSTHFLAGKTVEMQGELQVYEDGKTPTAN